MRRRAALALCLMAFAAVRARGDVFASLPPLGRYEARTIVTGTDMRSRPTGMALCLRDVLAKVSGDAALLADPRLLGVDAASLVADFNYVDRMGGLPHRDEEGSSDRPFYLTVRFDPGRVDALLRRLGEAPYAGPRPPVAVSADIHSVTARYSLAEPSLAREHRAALRAAADRVGLAVVVADAPAGNAPVGNAPVGNAPVADARAVPLAGSLDWREEAHGWVVTWRSSLWPAASWGASGVSFDEAYRVGLRGVLGLLSGHPPPSAP